MFKKFILVLLALLNVPLAHADRGGVLDLVDRVFLAALPNYKMVIGTSPGTGTFTILGKGTPVATVDGTGILFESGKGVGLSVYVPTLASTPVAGTNDIKKGFNAVPTVAANAAAGLPAVPVAGDTFEGFNEGANTVRIKAYGTPGINGGASGTYFPVATMTYFRCVAKSATAYQCGTLAVPTPAGP